MVLTPALRGLFGVEVDALNNSVTVDPHLPADWDHAVLRHVAVGSRSLDLSFQREGAFLVVKSSDSQIKLKDKNGNVARSGELRLPLPAVEVAIPHSLPSPGAHTAQLKVLRQSVSAHELSLELEAQGGSEYDLPLRENGLRSSIHSDGATVGNGSDAKGLSTLHVVFPAGDGYQRQSIRLTW